MPLFLMMYLNALSGRPPSQPWLSSSAARQCQNNIKLLSKSLVAHTGAIHQILFREGDQFAGAIEVLSLKGAGGTKGPARTTLTLQTKWN